MSSSDTLGRSSTCAGVLQVDLETIGRTADGFTGADLSALLSEAQLAAVHGVLDQADQPSAQVCRFPLPGYVLINLWYLACMQSSC